MLTENGKLLLSRLRQTPPSFQKLKDALDLGCYTTEDISMAATQYLDDCFYEHIETDYASRKAQNPIVIPGYHSSYVFDIISFLLDYGLNPNAIYEKSNIMYNLKYVNNGYLGADTLASLLEHGGDMNLILDGDTLFGSVDFDVMFDAFNQEDRCRFDALVHCWFVLLGYGAKLPNGDCPIDTIDNFDVSNLKNHKDYTFGLSKIPGRGEIWSLHVFDRNTLWEVARL